MTVPTWKWNVELPEKSEVVIFDLDGVLFDSKNNMYYSWLKVQETHSLQKVKFDKCPKTNGAMVTIKWQTKDLLAI